MGFKRRVVLTVALILSITVTSSAYAVVYPERAATESENMYVVSVQSGEQGCTGTLLTPVLVLTAAHCLYPLRPTVEVLAPNTSRTGTISSDRIQESTAYAVHPSYNNNSEGSDHDIALIHLPAPFKSYSTVSLPGSELLATLLKRTLFVLGFGENEQGTSPKTLMYATQQDLTASEILNRRDIPENFIAAGKPISKNKYSTTCRGDSGGPLLTLLQSKPTQLGITSYGVEDCVSSPGVYLKTTPYLNWITQTTKTLHQALPDTLAITDLEEKNDSVFDDGSLAPTSDIYDTNLFLSSTGVQINFKVTKEPLVNITSNSTLRFLADTNSDGFVDVTLTEGDKAVLNSRKESVCPASIIRTKVGNYDQVTINLDSICSFTKNGFLSYVESKEVFTPNQGFALLKKQAYDRANLPRAKLYFKPSLNLPEILYSLTGNDESVSTPQQPAPQSTISCLKTTFGDRCTPGERWVYEICAQQKVATLAINYNEKWVPISSITGKPSTKCPKNTPNLITISYP
ncbi:MAG: S1 family peptidase, partial [Candidatus Paceibacterota bacterium]